MRMLRLVAALLTVLPLGGCITSSTLLIVNADGSGTIEQTMLMGVETYKQITQMMGGLAGLGGQAKDAKPPELFSEAEARSMASRMGEGVSFVSSEKIKTAEAEGLRAVYAFSDITKLTLNERPATPGVAAPAVKLGRAEPENILFKFARQPGGSSVVTLVFPEVPAEEARKIEQAPAGRGVDVQKLDLARMVLKDLRITIEMQVAGRIVRTNSPHVVGSRVTIIDMDFNPLLADPALLKKLEGIESIEQARTALKGVKGFVFSPEREVTVEFVGR